MQYGTGVETVPSSEYGKTIKVVFSQATSKTAGGKQATGSGESPDTQKTYTLTVGGNSSLNVTWSSNVPAAPQVGNPYDFNLNTDANTAGTNALIYTTDTSSNKYGDTYTFTWDSAQSSMPSNWTVTGSGTSNAHLVYGNGTEAIPTSQAGATVKVVFSKATSMVAGGKAATGGDSGGEQKTYTLTIPNAPIWGTATGSIKFDTTGDGGDTGSITDGVQLNTSNMISNISSFPGGLTFKFSNGATEYGDFQIKTSGSNTYLLRLRYGTSTSPFVNSSDVGATDVFPTQGYFWAITACSVTEPTNCSTSGGSNNSVKITVNSDPNLVFYYKDTAQPNLSSLLSATTSPQGVPYPSDVPQTTTAPTLSAPTSVYTASGMSAGTKVVNDTFNTYLSPGGNSGTAPVPGYVSYSTGPSTVTSISFKAPSASDYAALMDTTSNTGINYLWAQSKASGTVKPSGTSTSLSNTRNLPRITVGDLILVPINGTTVNAGGSSNAAIGMTGISQGCSFGLTHPAVTAAAFTLATPPTGKTYKLKQLYNIASGSGVSANRGGVCSGQLTTGFQGTTCFGHSGTVYDATGVISDSGSSYCAGGTGSTTASGSTISSFPYTNGSYAIGGGGTYTVWVQATNMLGTQSGFPITYVPNTASTTTSPGAAPSMGGSNSTNDYSKYPIVTLN